MPYIPKQYDSARAFLKNYSNMGNVYDPMDQMRLSCYNLYDDFYYNRPDTFKVTIRGDSDVEIYVPSTKKIVNSTARFLAVDFDFQIKGGDAQAVETLLRKIWDRETILKRFIKGKRSMLSRGDVLWHITADDTKKAGDRISIQTIHPSSYFPIADPNNEFRTIGCHLVDLVVDPRELTKGPKADRSKLVARRQTYMKEPDGRISSAAGTFELGAWDDRYLSADEIKPISILWAKKYLPAQITALPVYLITNNEPDGSTWGMSQVSGMEYLINAMNQSITYEDLSLVLQGLGVYVTTAAPPRGPDGKVGKYKLHPGNVVQMSQGDTFDRVTGVASVQPFQDHIGAMDTWMLQGTGIPDMATGIVDVSVAQSGIALALKMGPIIAENSDKQEAIAGVWRQMGYDLIHGWFPAFEKLNAQTAEFTPTFGDPMPLDRESYIKERIDLYTEGLLLIDEVRRDLEKVGYKYAANITDQLIKEQERKTTAAQGDPYANSLDGTGSPNLIDTLSSSTNGSG